MAKTDYRLSDVGLDLSSDKAKTNVETVDFPEDHMADLPDTDLEGPQRHRGTSERDIIYNIVDKLDGFQVQFEGENLMILTQTEGCYITPMMIERHRNELIEAAKYIQRKYKQITDGKDLKLELIEEDRSVVTIHYEPIGVTTSPNANKAVWRFTHVLKYS